MDHTWVKLQVYNEEIAIILSSTLIFDRFFFYLTPEVIAKLMTFRKGDYSQYQNGGAI